MRNIIIIFVISILYPGICSGNSWDNLIKAIIKVESNGRSSSYSGDSVGVLQISSIMIEEVNDILGFERYSLKDRYDSLRSVEIFNIYQKHHNPALNHKRACQLWNGGSVYFLDTIKVKNTEIYYNKVLNELKKIEDGNSNSTGSYKSN